MRFLLRRVSSPRPPPDEALQLTAERAFQSAVVAFQRRGAADPTGLCVTLATASGGPALAVSAGQWSADPPGSRT